MTRDRILEDYWRKVYNEAELKNEKKEDSEEYGESETNAILKIILEKVVSGMEASILGVFDVAMVEEDEEELLWEKSRNLRWNPCNEDLKKMKKDKKSGKDAYLIRKHRIEEVKHED
ncbi:hypothetical protein Tco_1040896 [Tanacetum coccineum]|uniref:Uncharacterized protein n=1 Tax=Tanacetum coccineum TaxID=301880 RepID=A0ABQ5GG40_9ASTR